MNRAFRSQVIGLLYIILSCHWEGGWRVAAQIIAIGYFAMFVLFSIRGDTE